DPAGKLHAARPVCHAVAQLSAFGAGHGFDAGDEGCEAAPVPTLPHTWRLWQPLTSRRGTTGAVLLAGGVEELRGCHSCEAVGIRQRDLLRDRLPAGQESWRRRSSRRIKVNQHERACGERPRMIVSPVAKPDASL